MAGFATSAQDIAIRRNHLICGNSEEVGLLVLSDPPHIIVEDNRAEGCTTLKGYVLHVTSAEVRRNRQDNWSNGIAFATSSADAVYPDAVENITVTSNPGHTSIALRPYFYSTNYQTVYAIVVTAGGSSYSTSPKVSFGGGGCRTEPAGAVFQDNAGHVVGVNLISYGSGWARHRPQRLAIAGLVSRRQRTSSRHCDQRPHAQRSVASRAYRNARLE